MKRTIYTEEQRQEMKSLYTSGQSASQVAVHMKTDKGTLRRELKTMLPLRSISETRRITMGIKYVRSDAFDILTPEALYWIGFLYADGFIESKVPVLGLALSNADRDHVEKFNQFLGGHLNIAIIQQVNRTLKGIVNYDGQLARVKVADRQLYDKLVSLGFTGNKTHAIIPHELLKYSRDFWRGVVDGDGWISESKSTYEAVNKETLSYKYPKIGLCGNEATIVEFLKFIKLSGIECKSLVKKSKKENSLYSMDSSGQPAIQIMNVLYKDSTIYLDRKYQKYLEFITV